MPCEESRSFCFLKKFGCFMVSLTWLDRNMGCNLFYVEAERNVMCLDMDMVFIDLMFSCFLFVNA